MSCHFWSVKYTFGPILKPWLISHTFIFFLPWGFDPKFGLEWTLQVIPVVGGTSKLRRMVRAKIEQKPEAV